MLVVVVGHQHARDAALAQLGDRAPEVSLVLGADVPSDIIERAEVAVTHKDDIFLRNAKRLVARQRFTAARFNDAVLLLGRGIAAVAAAHDDDVHLRAVIQRRTHGVARADNRVIIVRTVHQQSLIFAVPAREEGLQAAELLLFNIQNAVFSHFSLAIPDVRYTPCRRSTFFSVPGHRRTDSYPHTSPPPVGQCPLHPPRGQG